MEKVVIGKSKIHFSVYDEDKKRWFKTDIDKRDKPFSWYLPYFIELERNITVADLVTHLAKHKDIIDLVFCGYMSDVKMEELAKELDFEPEAELDINKELSYIELYWNTELTPLDDEVDGVEFNIEQWPAFRGIYSADIDEVSVFENNFDLSLIALRNFKNKKLVIDEFVEFMDLDTESPSQETLFTGQKSWTLFDLIVGFLTEVTLHGNPDSQRFIKEDIEKDIAELENTQSIITSVELFDYLDSLDLRIK